MITCKTKSSRNPGPFAIYGVIRLSVAAKTRNFVGVIQMYSERISFERGKYAYELYSFLLSCPVLSCPVSCPVFSSPLPLKAATQARSSLAPEYLGQSYVAPKANFYYSVKAKPFSRTWWLVMVSHCRGWLDSLLQRTFKFLSNKEWSLKLKGLLTTM